MRLAAANKGQKRRRTIKTEEEEALAKIKKPRSAYAMYLKHAYHQKRNQILSLAG